MADIFISYNQADRDLVRLTAAFLEASGYTVWWDASLLAGDDFQLKILDEVAKARAVIVIWTPNSVKSTWVRSEAGRAQSDQKLIPLKAAGVTYDEIPPPFNLLHTEDASNRDAVLLSVKSQMGKPAPAPVLIKRARYEVLSWVGIIGSALTLFGHLREAIQSAKLVRLLMDNWVELSVQFWRKLLFFLPRLAVEDAFILTMTAFFVISFVARVEGRRGQAEHINATVRRLDVYPVVAILLIFLYSFPILPKDQYYGIFMMPVFAYYTLIERIVSGNEIAGVLTAWLVFSLSIFVLFIPKIRITNVLHWVLFFALLVASSPIIVIARAELFFPILVGAALAYELCIFGVIIYVAAILRILWGGPGKVDFGVVNVRLKRILMAIAFLGSINYGMLWLEEQPWAADLLK